jgi:WhiB family redox-sensing transcriptional regulator
VKSKAQEQYLRLNERIIAENERSGYSPPCRSKPKIFFPEDYYKLAEREEVEKLAKALCGRCYFANECLNYALAARETSGVWGGLTSRERQAMLRKLG